MNPSLREGELGPAPLPSPPPRFLVRALLALRRAILGFADALGPPELGIFDRVNGVAKTALLGFVARAGVADLLRSGPLSAEEIAGRLDTQPDATFRVLRGLATDGVFQMLKDGRFDNNRLSLALCSSNIAQTRAWVEYFSSRSNVTAWMDLGGTLRTGRNAFDRAYGKSVWDYFEDHPDERETFALAMMGRTVGQAPIIATLYPFREVGRVCDVGGGRGTLMSEILIRHPHLAGVLCDAAGVLESARSLLESRGVGSRVELVPGNFFEAVPSGCDAYVLKNVLHDWNDALCGQILQVCHAAMPGNARLLIAETLVERLQTSGMGPLSDMQMMVACREGRERSREDLRRLLERAGFAVQRVFEHPVISVVESRRG